MRIFEQDLAELKETMRRCEAQIKRRFPQQQQQQQKGPTEDGETRLGPSPDDGAAFRLAKRPHIVMSDFQETAQLSPGATKKSTASTTTTKGRKSTLSDAAWAKDRAASSRHDIPAQRPAYVHFHRLESKWRYTHRASGINEAYDTVDAVYDAALGHQQRCSLP